MPGNAAKNTGHWDDALGAVRKVYCLGAVERKSLLLAMLACLVYCEDHPR
jgi:hypothetical protein